jgi:hypothetical protein
MILPHDANLRRMAFSERTGVHIADLPDYIDKHREIALKESQQLGGIG